MYMNMIVVIAYLMILVYNGTEVLTSTVGMKDESKGRLVQKAKVGILLILNPVC
jgi:hypothetical protein